MKEDELLPCPFYKIDKELGHNPYAMQNDDGWYIQCTCGARSSVAPTEDWAIKAWNTRDKSKRNDVIEECVEAGNSIRTIHHAQRLVKEKIIRTIEALKNKE